MHMTNSLKNSKSARAAPKKRLSPLKKRLNRNRIKAANSPKRPQSVSRSKSSFRQKNAAGKMPRRSSILTPKRKMLSAASAAAEDRLWRQKIRRLK